MNRKSFKLLVTALLIVAMALPAMAITSSAAATSDPMSGSHGFYMTTYGSVVDNKADGFMIDFFSESTDAIHTYWSNMNFSMYTKPTEKLLKAALTGGGAYAGLQITNSPTTRTGIMSMWRYEYFDLFAQETKYIYAKAIVGKTTTYDNEGSGTSCVMPFDWKSNQWYRELLFCWDDEETGKTFAGNWYYDYETKEWSLFAYYNTFLVESYFTSDISQFLENYVHTSRNYYRQFQYRNVYYLSHENSEWVSSPKVYLRTDANWKAWGEAVHGQSDDGTYVWAWVKGDSAIDSDEKNEKMYTLVQPAKPEYGTPVIDKASATNTDTATTIQWEMPATSTPQLSYTIEVKDSNGNVVATKYETRPEVRKATFEDLPYGEYTYALTVKDVFGQTSDVKTVVNKNENVTPTTPTPTNVPATTQAPATSTAVPGTTTAPETTAAPATSTAAPETTTAPETETEEKNDNTTLIVIIVASVVFVGCAAYLIFRKKK